MGGIPGAIRRLGMENGPWDSKHTSGFKAPIAETQIPLIRDVVLPAPDDRGMRLREGDVAAICRMERRIDPSFPTFFSKRRAFKTPVEKVQVQRFEAGGGETLDTFRHRQCSARFVPHYAE